MQAAADRDLKQPVVHGRFVHQTEAIARRSDLLAEKTCEESHIVVEQAPFRQVGSGLREVLSRALAVIPAVLIPYGHEFPWISAHWEHSAFRIAAHVQDRRRAIAQTVALAILDSTGHRLLN